MAALTLSSPVFKEGEPIPQKYSCVGEDINPPLLIQGLPPGSQSLVLIVDDPDAPKGTWDHWVMWNIPLIREIAEDSVPEGALQGENSWGRQDYGGPCPPSGVHRYRFKVYALDIDLHLAAGSRKADVEAAMEGHTVGKAQLVGLFQKPAD